MNPMLYGNDKERAIHSDAIHTLARESGLPEVQVARIYEQALEKLKGSARVKEFLPLLTRRMVKENLRNHP